MIVPPHEFVPDRKGLCKTIFKKIGYCGRPEYDSCHPNSKIEPRGGGERSRHCIRIERHGDAEKPGGVE